MVRQRDSNLTKEIDIKIPEHPKIIFLLGAGASIPAGIPSIDEMTKEFLEDPLLAGHGYGRLSSRQWTSVDLRKPFGRLFEITKNHLVNLILN